LSGLLGSHNVSVCHDVICLSVSRPISITKRVNREISSPLWEIGVAPEVAKYPKSILPQQQFWECASLLFCSINEAACYVWDAMLYADRIDIGVMTLTFQGHVTSSMTSSFDPP